MSRIGKLEDEKSDSLKIKSAETIYYLPHHCVTKIAQQRG